MELPSGYDSEKLPAAEAMVRAERRRSRAIEELPEGGTIVMHALNPSIVRGGVKRAPLNADVGAMPAGRCAAAGRLCVSRVNATAARLGAPQGRGLRNGGWRAATGAPGPCPAPHYRTRLTFEVDARGEGRGRGWRRVGWKYGTMVASVSGSGATLRGRHRSPAPTATSEGESGRGPPTPRTHMHHIVPHTKPTARSRPQWRAPRAPAHDTALTRGDCPSASPAAPSSASAARRRRPGRRPSRPPPHLPPALRPRPCPSPFAPSPSQSPPDSRPLPPRAAAHPPHPTPPHSKTDFTSFASLFCTLPCAEALRICAPAGTQTCARAWKDAARGRRRWAGHPPPPQEALRHACDDSRRMTPPSASLHPSRTTSVARPPPSALRACDAGGRGPDRC